HEPLRIGRIIYLVVIGALVIWLFHFALGHLYLLRGDGFVYAKNTVVALEFDARITALYVEEGDTVEPGQLLLRYDSFALRRDFVEFSTRISELERRVSEARIQKSRLDATIETAHDYSELTQEVENAVAKLHSQGLASNSRISTEAMRRFEARRDLLAFIAERDQIAAEASRLAEGIKETRGYLNDLIARFDDGEVRAGERGVVTSLSVSAGAVAKKGDPLLRIFSGKRFILSYLNDASPVSRAPGEPVIVALPAGTITLGRIARITSVADRLPEEFQPRFKPTARQHLVAIEVDPRILARYPVMTTAAIYKPLGLATVMRLASANP
ncbi:MAG: HlyD family secretion protein, partial [Rhodoplanes sp.]